MTHCLKKNHTKSPEDGRKLLKRSDGKCADFNIFPINQQKSVIKLRVLSHDINDNKNKQLEEKFFKPYWKYMHISVNTCVFTDITELHKLKDKIFLVGKLRRLKYYLKMVVLHPKELRCSI